MGILDLQLIANNLNELQNTSRSIPSIKYIYLILHFLAMLMFTLSDDFIEWVDVKTRNYSDLLIQGSAFKQNSITSVVYMVLKKLYLPISISPYTLYMVTGVLIGIEAFIIWQVVRVRLWREMMPAIAIILVCYTSVFLILNQHFIRLLICKNYELVETNQSQSDLYFNAEVLKRILQSEPIYIRSIKANYNIQCYSVQHGIAATLGVVGILLNFTIKLIATKFLKFIPDYHFDFIEKGFEESIKALVIFVCIVVRNCINHKLDNDSYSIEIVQYLVFYSLIVLLGFQILFRGFYSEWTVRVSTIQLFIGISSMGSFIIPILLKMKISEFTYYLVCLMLFSVVYRVADNFGKRRRQYLQNLWAIHPKEITTVDNIMEVYYYQIELIHLTMSDTMNDNHIKRAPYLYIAKYIDEHKKKCRDLRCPCDNRELPYEFDPLGVIRDELKMIEWLSMTLFTTSDFLSNAFKRNKTEKMLCLVSYFEAVYKGQLTTGYLHLDKISRDGPAKDRVVIDSSKSFLKARVLETINTYCKGNVINAELGMTKILREYNLINKDKSQIDVHYYFEFLDQYRLFKENISECIELRTKFITEILKSGDLRKAHPINESFSDYCFEINRKYQRIKDKAPSFYSPLLLVYGEFQYFVFQEFSHGRKLLSEFKKKSGLTKLALEGFSTPHDVCLVFAYLSTNSTGLITYITANLLKRTGFEKADIEDGGIEYLIPEPIQSTHQEFMNAGKQGALLQNSKLTHGFCNSKNGVVEVELSIRHSLSIMRGVEYVSSICFPETNSNNSILLIDKNGKIRSMNLRASRFFDVGRIINRYSPELGVRLASMQQYLEESLKDNFTQGKVKELFDKGQIEESLIYYDSLEYSWVEITSKSHLCFLMRVRFEKQLYESNNFNFWVLRISDIKQQDQNIYELSEEHEDRHPIPTATLIAGNLINRIIFNEKKNAVKKKIEIEEKNLGNKEFTEDKEEVENKTLQLPKALQIEEPRKSILNTIPRGSIFFGNTSSKLLETSQAFFEARNRRESQTREKTPFNRKNIAKNIQRIREKNIKKKNINQKVEDLDIGSSVNTCLNEEHSGLIKISMVIHKYIKPDKIHFPTIIMTIIILMLLTGLFTLVIIKVPVQQSTNTELRDQAITLDYYSNQITGFARTMIILEKFRYVKEGFMSAVMEFRPGKPLRIRLNTAYYRVSCKALQIYDLYIQDKVSRVTDRALFEYDDWVSLQARVQDYTIDNNTNRPIWYVHEYNRREAISMVSARLQNFCLRDYENDTLPFIGINRDRDADPEEEYIRRNLVGDIFNKMSEGYMHFSQYLKKLSIRNEDYTVWTFVASLLIAISTLMLIWCYVFFEVRSMREFYKAVFRIKEDEFIKIADDCFDRSTILKESLREESLEITSKKGKKKISSSKTKTWRSLTVKTTKKSNNTSNRVSEMLKIDQKHPYFGFDSAQYKLILLVLLFCLVQLIHFLFIYPKAKRVTFLTKAYSLSVDTWLSYYRVNMLFTEVISWNNTINGGRGEPILDTWRSAVDYMENQIFSEILASKDYDLGDYSEEYSRIMFTGNACETVYKLPAHPNCGQYFNGLFTGSYFDSLRAAVEVLKREVFIWEYSRESWDIVIRIIEEEHMEAYWNYNTPISTAIYAIFTVPLVNLLMSQLEENLTFLGVANNIVLLILTTLFFAGLAFIIFPLQKKLKQYHAFLYVIPIEVIDQNMMLKQSLMRVRHGEFFFKI